MAYFWYSPALALLRPFSTCPSLLVFEPNQLCLRLAGHTMHSTLLSPGFACDGAEQRSASNMQIMPRGRTHPAALRLYGVCLEDLKGLKPV